MKAECLQWNNLHRMTYATAFNWISLSATQLRGEYAHRNDDDGGRMKPTRDREGHGGSVRIMNFTIVVYGSCLSAALTKRLKSSTILYQIVYIIGQTNRTETVEKHGEMLFALFCTYIRQPATRNCIIFNLHSNAPFRLWTCVHYNRLIWVHQQITHTHTHTK